MNICYFLFFSFLLLSGNIQSFASDDLFKAPDAKTPLLSGYQPLVSGGSIQEGDSVEGRGAGSAAAHTETSRPLPSSIIPSSADLLRKLDLAPAQEGLTHIAHYLCVVGGIKLQQEQSKGRSLTQDERTAIKIKRAIAEKYRDVCFNEEHLEIHLLALARAAIPEHAPLRRLLNEAIGKIDHLQKFAEKLMEQNQQFRQIMAETQQQLRISQSATIQVAPAQTADVMGQDERIESLVRSNRCRCYAIGGLSTALSLSLIYGTWSLIHILH